MSQAMGEEMSQQSPEARMITLFKKKVDGEEMTAEERLGLVCAKMPDGKRLEAETMIIMACQAMRRNNRLAQSTPASIAGAIFESATLGLMVDGLSGEAYLVPYKVKGVMTCQLQIGFRGFVKLAYQSGRVQQFAAHAVHEGDEFDWRYGTRQFLDHKPQEFNDGEERPPVTHAYAMIATTTGGHDFEVMDQQQINKIMRGSPAWKFAESKYKDSPWHKYYPEMAAKTAIRKLAKRVPLSTEFVRAGNLDELADAAIDQKLNVAGFPEIPHEPPADPISEEESLRKSLPKAEGEHWDDDGHDVEGLFGKNN